MKKYVWRIAIVTLAILFVGQMVYLYASRYYNIPKAPAHAAYRPVDSFAQLVDQADVIIEGEVLRVEAGPDTVVTLDNPTGGAARVDRIPNQHVVVRVVNAQKGAMKAGEELIVRRTGGEVQLPDAPAVREDVPSERQAGPPGAPAPGVDGPKPDPDNVPAQVQRQVPKNVITLNTLADVEGDPAYSVGEQVFLLLEQQPGATPNAPAEAGVYQPVHPAGRYTISGDTLKPVIDADVSMSVSQRSLGEVQAAARGETEIPTDPQLVRRRVATGMPTTGVADLQPIALAWLGLALILLGVGLALVSPVLGRLSARRGGK